MKFHPFFMRIENKSCLVVGGGQLALRRTKTLQSSGALVDIISPWVCDTLQELVANNQQHNIINEKFSAELITKSYFCIIAATDDHAVNKQVAAYAKAANIPVNVVDDQKQCDFIFPSVINREPLTIAVSNSGKSPVLSRILKQQIEMFIPSAYGELSSFVGDNRSLVRKAIPDSKERKLFWEAVLQGAIAETLFSGKREHAQSLLNDALLASDFIQSSGEVYLIGAGPGDPDLLTLRAFRLLQQADVVLYDRLVSEEVMALIKPTTELIYVGKRRSDHSVPQANINQLLVEHAKKGKRVARLKGGDPFIFGRGGEEIETLFDEGVPFQVIPGITAANGCSSYAGIPLTHRDYAQSVQFVTGQLKDGSIDLNWKELIVPGKTLVFYMGLKSLNVICASLIEHGMRSEMTCALIEKGTTKSQRILTSTLERLGDDMAQLQVSSPSLFIVGDVVQLHEKLRWYKAHE